MYSFICDYSEGAHPNIMKALTDAIYEQNDTYNYDIHCQRAAEMVKKLIKRDDVDVYFMPGGTATNTISIAAALRPFEAVISPNTGHIEVHETGAIESSGHKILPVESPDGKLTPALIQKVLNGFEDEHTVKRKMVFLTNPTESGTIYQKAELEAIRKICDENDMYLYIDGARLGTAIVAEGNDVTMEDLPNYADIFYIGGTKIGALFAEALIIVNDKIKPDFRFMIKQRGALTAKSSAIGIQFEELLKDNLYFELAKHSVDMAQKLAKGVEAMGYEFLAHSPTNQVFPILPRKLIEELHKEYSFYIWAPSDETRAAIRLVCSWATPEKEVDQFLADLKKLSEEYKA